MNSGTSASATLDGQRISITSVEDQWIPGGIGHELRKHGQRILLTQLEPRPQQHNRAPVRRSPLKNGWQGLLFVFDLATPAREALRKRYPKGCCGKRAEQLHTDRRKGVGAHH